MVESYHYDEMQGQEITKTELPVRIKAEHGDFKEGYCNLTEWDFQTRSGYANLGDSGLVSLGVHGNSNYTFRILGEVKGVCNNPAMGKRPENVRMQNFLAANGIRAKAKYQFAGSMRGTWRLFWPDTPWTQELVDKLSALGFQSAHCEPLSIHNGNGGTFSVSVRGHDELVKDPQPERSLT